MDVETTTTERPATPAVDRGFLRHLRRGAGVIPPRERVVHFAFLSVGAVIGLKASLPLDDVASRCPAPGEGLVYCQLQKSVFPAVVVFVAALLFSQGLFVLLAYRLPEWRRRLRSGERLRLGREERAPAPPDPILSAATWGTTEPAPAPASEPPEHETPKLDGAEMQAPEPADPAAPSSNPQVPEARASEPDDPQVPDSETDEAETGLSDDPPPPTIAELLDAEVRESEPGPSPPEPPAAPLPGKSDPVLAALLGDLESTSGDSPPRETLQAATRGHAAKAPRPKGSRARAGRQRSEHKLDDSVPSFCRHNRFLQNCPICREPEPAEAAEPRRGGGGSGAKRTGRGGAPAGLQVRRADRAADDGYRCRVVPGLKSSVDAERLASELAWAAGRLAELATEPPGLYADVVAADDPEEAAWLAFQIAYVAPLEGEDPFAAIRSVRTTWESGDLPDLDEAALGARTAHDPERGAETLQAYRAWAARSGSQIAALTGDESWSPERRFDRIFERLALPGLTRGSRYDFLASLGRLGVGDLRASALYLRGSCPTTVAAKRIFGIGDAILLDRRAALLADACEVELEALDLALHNWEREAQRTTMGAGDDAIRLAPSASIVSGLGL